MSPQELTPPHLISRGWPYKRDRSLEKRALILTPRMPCIRAFSSPFPSLYLMRLRGQQSVQHTTDVERGSHEANRHRQHARLPT
jgi:hypothetical protein